MSHFSEPTRPFSDRTTKMITLDSFDHFYGRPADTQCRFDVDLENPLHISKPSTVYLESVYIGGYKINEKKKLLFPNGSPSNPPQMSKDIVTHFNFNIPELGIITYAGSKSTRSSAFGGCFTLPNERPTKQATVDTLVATDYQPYFLGHLSRTAVYISSLQPKSLTRFTVQITDQNGDSIWKAVTDATTSSDLNAHGAGNPPLASRRVVIQLIIAENT